MNSAIRLDKLLSNLGYCSRSRTRKFMRECIVLVKGQTGYHPDDKVLPEDVTIDGAPIDPIQGMVVLLHKPRGYVCSRKDSGALIYDLIPERFNARNPPLSSVGRLDQDTSGMLLLTDDGKLLHRLTSPRHHVKKLYRVTSREPISIEAKDLFEKGGLLLEDEEQPLKPAGVELISETEALLTLTEGRYHQIRRMFAATGNEVITLHREKIGNLELGALAEGSHKILSFEEIESCFQ